VKRLLPTLGEQLEPVRFPRATILRTVKVRAVRFAALLAVLALFELEEVGVEFLLLPPMRVGAHVLEGAAFGVGGYEIVSLPGGAHLMLVREDGGLPTVVLPVMCIETDLPIMVIIAVGAPHCLEVVHVKVHVNRITLNQLN